MGRARLPKYISRAIKSGPVIQPRDWRGLKIAELTRAEKVMYFIEHFLKVPEGDLVGKDIHLDLFQEVFIYAIYDNPEGTLDAYLSIARKNGKSALIACLLLAHVIGPEARENSQIVSGALSRSQAALVFHLARKMVELNETLFEASRIIPSQKQILGLKKKVEFTALSAEASTTFGHSPVMAILDEVGQIRGPTSQFIDAVTTSQGAYDNPLLIAISTEAPSDADMFSQWCDDAERTNDPNTVCHAYTTNEDDKITSKQTWKRSNPALGIFRSERDLKKQVDKAVRLPSKEPSVRNLLLNQRVSAEKLWIAPSIWKSNSAFPDLEVFKNYPTALGLDLSGRQDLTAGVFAAEDDEGFVHLLPYCFTPEKGLRERAEQDRTPYDVWVRQGFLFVLPGRSIDYDQVAKFLKERVEEHEIELQSVEFDRWRIDVMKKAAARESFANPENVKWHSVGQGFRDFSPRCEAFEAKLLDGKIKHGKHPLLTMGAANAIAVRDPTDSVKLDKMKSTLRIDPLVAAVMASYAVTDGEDEEEREEESLYNDTSRQVIM